MILYPHVDSTTNASPMTHRLTPFVCRSKQPELHDPIGGALHIHKKTMEMQANMPSKSYGLCADEALLRPVELAPVAAAVPEIPASLAPPVCETVAWTALATDVADGTLAVPVPISSTFVSEELNLVGAREIS